MGEGVVACPKGAAQLSIQRIHLGAHKTATTHLQLTLAQLGIAPTLEDFRAAFWRLPEQRRILGRDILGHRRWSAIRQFGQFPLISDENVLCEAHEACAGYDAAVIRPRARKLARSVGLKRPKAFLAIRNPAEFAASVYSEALRHRPEMVDRETTRRIWGEPDNWLGLVGILTDYFDLTVWRYEDYRGHRQAITEAIAGHVLPKLPNFSDPPQTRRLSREEVRLIEERNVASAMSVGEDVPGGKFSLFDDQEKRDAKGAYDRECAAIAKSVQMLVF